MCHRLEDWKVPHNNFYPISIVNVFDQDRKSTTIVVSSVDQVFALQVEGDLDTVAAHLSSKNGLFVKCELANRICGLKRTSSKLILLTADGKLSEYDYATRQFTCIDDFSNIRHVDRGPEANHFSVVRQAADTRFVLEVVDDSDGFARTTTKRYELVTDCIDPGATFSIGTFTVDEANRRFLGDFLGFSTLSNGEKVTLIAIYNRLHWLQERAGGDCDLLTVRCFSSNVLGFEFFYSSTSLTVLLEAGILVVFNQSVHPDTLLISSSTVCLQPPIEAHAFDKTHSSFLYSNGLTTHRVRYHFSEETRQLVIETEELPVYGVVAMTLIDTREMAILLTENCQFYVLELTDRSQHTDKHSSRMLTLRREMRSAARRTTKLLTDEVQFDKRLDQAIQNEQAQFHVLALYRNQHAFSNLSRIETSFHHEMPVVQSNTALVENQQPKLTPCVFASVTIEINLGFFKLLREQKRWAVCVQYDENVLIYPLHETFNPLGVFHAIVFLDQKQLARGLPTFGAFLLAPVRSGADNLLLTIPIPPSIPSHGDTGHLIKKLGFAAGRTESYATDPTYQIILQNNPFPVKGAAKAQRRIIHCCILNEQSKAKAASFSSALANQAQGDTWSVCGAPVTVRWQRGKDALSLASHHPGALDLVKRFLLLDDEYSAEIEQRRRKLKGICLELQAVSSATLIEQLYMRIRRDDLFLDES